MERTKEMNKTKIIARYIIIVFVLYLAYEVTSLDYINGYTNKDFVLNTVVTAVFAALTLIIKYHFETKVDDGDR